MTNERIALTLACGFFCFMAAALIIGFRAARDFWTWKDEDGKRIAWTLSLIAVGFAIAFGVYVFTVQ